MLGSFRGEDRASLFGDPAAAASGVGQAQGMDFLRTPPGGKGSDGGGPLGSLIQMLDQDGDGSALDDVLVRFMRQ